MAHLAITGLIGLLSAAAAAAVILVIGHAGAPAPDGLVRAFWILDAIAAAVSAVTLASSLVGWVLYQRRRADLDAQGAEAMGELLARLANSGRRHRP